MNDALAARARRRTQAGRQAGFTLVELVTVILILGVLAAVALPRYADLQGKARAAKVQGVLGSIRAASGLIKASATANGTNCATASVTSAGAVGVTLEGTAIDLNYCYAQAIKDFTKGILAAANVSANDNWVFDTTNQGGIAGGSHLQINLSDGATPANCSISYTSPAAANTQPIIAADVSVC